jgi:hypothetical protein
MDDESENRITLFVDARELKTTDGSGNTGHSHKGRSYRSEHSIRTKSARSFFYLNFALVASWKLICSYRINFNLYRFYSQGSAL